MNEIKVADRSLLFVYGTLKRGYNMQRLVPDAKFMDEAVIAGFNIYNLGSYPGITHSDDEDDFVFGELWSVSDEGLARLDRYEGSAYRKIQVEVTVIDDQYRAETGIVHTTTATTYLYLGNVDTLKPIASGEWSRSPTKEVDSR